MTPVTVQEQNIGEPRNPHYEKDIVYIFKHSRWILNSIGIWPSFLKNNNQFQQNFSIGLCNIVLLFAILPFTLYLAVEEKNLMIRVKLIGFLSFCWISLLKYWALIACKPNLKSCIEFVQHDWREVEQKEDREVMLKYGNVGRNLTLLCVVFMSSGGFMYHTIAQYAIGSHVNEHNRTIKPLVYPTYSRLFDPQPRPFYELVYAVHSLNGCILSAITVGVCGLAALFATHICGQIDIMILRLQNLAQLGVNTDLHPKLVKIIQHHVRTLRYDLPVMYHEYDQRRKYIATPFQIFYSSRDTSARYMLFGIHWFHFYHMSARILCYNGALNFTVIHPLGFISYASNDTCY